MLGICNLSIIPCRKEPSDKSEQVTQLLFGEEYEILDTQGKWTQIKCTYDAYEAWISTNQVCIKSTSAESISSEKNILCADVMAIVEDAVQHSITPITLGSTLPNFKNGQFKIDALDYTFKGETNSATETTRESIIHYAFYYLNSPYLWGGKTPWGIDCSGFTQMVYKLSGIKLNRDAYQQAEQGTTLNFLEEAQEGDLAFFDNEEGRIVHVGIILKNNKIIHASGKVRVDTLDHFGVFNTDVNKYTHRLRLIKTVY